MAASLRQLGGALADHEFVSASAAMRSQAISTSDFRGPKIIQSRGAGPIASGFAGIAIGKPVVKYFGNLHAGKFIMCADADVIFVRDFSDLLEDLATVTCRLRA